MTKCARERTHDLWCAALREEVRYDLEFRIRREDGVYRWFKVRATPLRDKTGAIVKWFATCTDIEDQKEAQRHMTESARELERRVAESTAELREMVQELASFSYSVSHDLRSPPRAICGFGTLALERGGERLEAQTREYLHRIVNAALRADRLVRDVLIYSRVSRASFQLAPVDLEKLMRGVLEQNEQLQAPRAEIEWQTPLLQVMAHEPSLAQCVTNLLTNVVNSCCRPRPLR